MSQIGHGCVQTLKCLNKVSAAEVKFYYFLNNLYSSSQNGSQPATFQAMRTLPVNSYFHVKINNSRILCTRGTDKNMRQKRRNEGVTSAMSKIKLASVEV